MRTTTAIFLTLFLWITTSTSQAQIIPQPNKITPHQGTFDTSIAVRILGENISQKTLSQLSDWVVKTEHFVVANKQAKHTILFRKTTTILNEEGYTLNIEKDKIQITASSEKGLFYGLQSLLQLTTFYGTSHNIPLQTIEDSPRFSYRGMHLDVSRHFFSMDFLKKQLDLMAYYKLNRFHWHLTDGPGWRLEIKKYPLLTQKGAWRTHRTWKAWWASDRKYLLKKDFPDAYGGFYTQKEALEIVQYAAQRHITVIPEIEMPGHSEEVLALYPQLACSEKPYTQSEFCIGNEATFTFLENVLTEVMAIFPSKYIHIGGDEADFKHWENCPKCQKRMSDNGLQSAAELQSYLIRRIEKFLHSHHRRLLGWDEILKGGLPPDATVMSWRGEEGAIQAAQSGHQAIMTPGKHCYFDFYQADPSTQPEAIGGFLPLDMVYAYDPIPKILSKEESQKILGVQANVWTEYMPSEAHTEYMIYPRLLALSEVAWTIPTQKKWSDFKRRVNGEIEHLLAQGVNTYTLRKNPYYRHHTDKNKAKIVVEIDRDIVPSEIRYTTDGSLPTNKSNLYAQPLEIDSATILSSRLFRNGKPLGETKIDTFVFHKGIGKKITYQKKYSDNYPASGNQSLLDGNRGGRSYNDGRWQGFNNTGIEVVLDLKAPTPISRIQANFIQASGAWVWLPSSVTIAISDDGTNFKILKTLHNNVALDTSSVIFKKFGWQGNLTTRYIKYIATHCSKGGWLFTDEIEVW